MERKVAVRWGSPPSKQSSSLGRRPSFGDLGTPGAGGGAYFAGECLQGKNMAPQRPHSERNLAELGVRKSYFVTNGGLDEAWSAK